MSTDAFDAKMLDLAARLALRGFGRVEPGAMVGAVITRDSRIIGLGHHRRVGGLHAEAEALADCASRGEDARGATVYCTLEPCNGYGRNPPCAPALIRAGISRVVYARRDPNPAKAGGGAALTLAGVMAELSESSVAAVRVGAPFVKRVTTGLPWVIAKWAQTIDGRVATRTGASKWISNEHSRARVHRLRSRVDAIMTGIGTVLADDPLLTPRLARGPAARSPMRVIVDARLDLPPESQLVRTARQTPTVVACDAEVAESEGVRARRERLEAAGVLVRSVPRAAKGQRIDLRRVLAMLASEWNVCNVMVEAGPRLLGSLLEYQLIDQAIVYIAPLVLGDEMAQGAAAGREAESLRQAAIFDLGRVKRLAGDLELTYFRRAER